MKKLGPVFNFKLGPVFNFKTPQILDQFLTLTAYIYIYIYAGRLDVGPRVFKKRAGSGST